MSRTAGLAALSATRGSKVARADGRFRLGLGERGRTLATHLRLVPTRANGQPAFGSYLPDAQAAIATRLRTDGPDTRRGPHLRVLTGDEIRGLTAGLLVSHQHALGRVSFVEWLKENASTLGRAYANELDRHFRVRG